MESSFSDESEYFVREIDIQASFVALAWNDLQDAHRSNDEQRLWYSVQSILVAADNLSKLFWPPRPNARSITRARFLADAFAGVDNRILKDRSVRDHFEHFDERLDEWKSESLPKVFSDLHYPLHRGYSATIDSIGTTPVKHLRSMKCLWIVSCLDDEIDLEQIVAATEKLRTRALNLLRPSQGQRRRS